MYVGVSYIWIHFCAVLMDVVVLVLTCSYTLFLSARVGVLFVHMSLSIDGYEPVVVVTGVVVFEDFLTTS